MEASGGGAGEPRAREATYEPVSEYFRRPDVVSEYASFEFLLAPELMILEELAPSLSAARMLDVGVGAGRTTLHFAPLVREYVGIDISPNMIDACRKRFEEMSSNVSFAVGDVRDLREFDSASFDFVLFSFNGIDTVGDKQDRSAALSEIQRVCRPGAVFCFSSSNLRFALARSSIAASLWMALRSHASIALRQPRKIRKVVTETRRWKRLNPAMRALAARGEGMVVEERPRFEYSTEFFAAPHERIRVEKYYIDPVKQVNQLETLGFRDTRIFRLDGREVDVAGGRASRWWWVYYLCTKRTPC